MASLHPRVRMIPTSDIEIGWRESHQQELPCLASYGKVRADRLRRLRRLRARATETPPGTCLLCRRSGETARTNPAFRQKTLSALWRGLSLLSGSPKLASNAAVSSFQTVGCIMHIEMRGGRFAVMNQANQRLPSLDVQG